MTRDPAATLSEIFPTLPSGGHEHHLTFCAWRPRSPHPRPTEIGQGPPDSGAHVLPALPLDANMWESGGRSGEVDDHHPLRRQVVRAPSGWGLPSRRTVIAFRTARTQPGPCPHVGTNPAPGLGASHPGLSHTNQENKRSLK